MSKDLQKYQAVSLSNNVKKTWKSLLGSVDVSCLYNYVAMLVMFIVQCSSEVLSSAGMQSICELFGKLIECAQFTAQMIDFIETTFK